MRPRCGGKLLGKLTTWGIGEAMSSADYAPPALLPVDQVGEPFSGGWRGVGDEAEILVDDESSSHVLTNRRSHRNKLTMHRPSRGCKAKGSLPGTVQ